MIDLKAIRAAHDLAILAYVKWARRPLDTPEFRTPAEQKLDDRPDESWTPPPSEKPNP